MSLLELDRIEVAYPVPGGLFGVVQGLSLQLRRGGIGCLLGRSGSGKTTVLRAIAGFEPVRAGRIVLDGTVLATPDTALPPERRRIGMMFQDYALFPHLDVAANVAFGLRRLAEARRTARVVELLDLVGLADKAHAWPHELSGGQQQRVALARALAPEPALLLLDEPFSNLDIHTREHLAGELRDLLKAAGTTALLVTHDQAEAFAMADHVGVMHRGRILQWADAATLYREPADRFVAGFIGRGNLVPAVALGLAGEGEVLLRPEHLHFDPDGPIRARLLERTFRGPDSVCLLELAGGARCEADLPLAVVAGAGDELRFRLLDEGLPRFPARDTQQ